VREGLAFFLDRGLGSRIVANGLRAEAWAVTTMDERYGVDRSQNIDDPSWIREASRRGEILLSKDRAIAKRPLEAEAIYYTAAKTLVVSSARVTGAEILAWLIANESAIERLASREGPWVFGVYRDRIAELRLNFP
jgi:hypothetical protein